MSSVKRNVNYRTDSGLGRVNNLSSAHESPMQKAGRKDKSPGVMDIVARSKWFGIIGSVLLLPAVAITCFFFLSQYLLGTPSRIALTVLLNMLALGSIGYILGARLKPYEYVSRAFLALAIIATAISIAAGIIIGVGFLLYMLFKLVVMLVKLAAVIGIIGLVLYILFLATGGDSSNGGDAIAVYKVTRVRTYRRVR